MIGYATTSAGWMESNLPFFFLVFPPFFKARNPELVANARGNAHRLVTAYDIHKTLKHLLHLQTRSTSWSNDEDAADSNSSKPLIKSFSLLTKIPSARSCDDAGIPAAFCSCSNLEEIDANSSVVTDAAKAIVRTINEALEPVKDICGKWHLERVVKAMKRPWKREYSVLVETAPEAKFQGWVEMKRSRKMVVGIGQISRVDEYGLTSVCVLKRRYDLKAYCRCKNF